MPLDEFRTYVGGSLVMDGAVLNVALIRVFGLQVDGYVEDGENQSGKSSLIIHKIWAKPFKLPYNIKKENIIDVQNN